MKSLRILTHDMERLEAVLFERTDVESAAYLRCAVVADEADVTFLVRDVIPVADHHYRIRDIDRLSITSDSFIPVIKKVREEGEAFVFIHTHPEGPRAFSLQDDAEEEKLFTTVRARAAGRPHASMVFVDRRTFVGRVYDDTTITALDRLVVVGDRLSVLAGTPGAAPLPAFFDRHVRAFGEEAQRMFGHLRIAIVGGGGTGSPVFEQCLRLGFGDILVVDHDDFDVTNVNRVYNSRCSDEGKPKVQIIERTAWDIDLPTTVRTIQGSINDSAVARQLLHADVIFGCTDKELPRAILCRIATRYLIPVIDMGVVVSSANGVLTGVTGRITTMFPGTSCLMCRERISPAMIRAESLPPDERRTLAAEIYAPELDIPNPAVIPFTTAVGAFAVSELLHRLTGYMGDRVSTEMLIQFDRAQLRSNATPAEAWCDCANSEHWGRGDEDPFLGMSWPDQELERQPQPTDAHLSTKR